MSAPKTADLLFSAAPGRQKSAAKANSLAAAAPPRASRARPHVSAHPERADASTGILGGVLGGAGAPPSLTTCVKSTASKASSHFAEPLRERNASDLAATERVQGPSPRPRIVIDAFRTSDGKRLALAVAEHADGRVELVVSLAVTRAGMARLYVESALSKADAARFVDALRSVLP